MGRNFRQVKALPRVKNLIVMGEDEGEEVFFDDLATVFFKSIRADRGRFRALIGCLPISSALATLPSLGSSDGGLKGSLLNLEGSGEIAKSLLLLKGIIKGSDEREDAVDGFKTAPPESRPLVEPPPSGSGSQGWEWPLRHVCASHQDRYGSHRRDHGQAEGK